MPLPMALCVGFGLVVIVVSIIVLVAHFFDDLT